MTFERKKIMKILVIVLFVIIAIFEALFFTVKGMVKPEIYREQIIEAIKKHTGQDVKINGEVRFMLFPSPKIVFNDMEMDNSAGLVAFVPKISVQKTEIHIAFMSLFSDNIKLSGINLVNPVLSLERADDNTIHWDWLNTRLLKLFNTKDNSNISFPIYIRHGILRYDDKINNNQAVFENIEASAIYGAQLSLSGTMKTANHSFSFAIDSKTYDLPVSDVEFPLNLQLNIDDKSIVQIQGVIDPSGEIPKIYGNLNFDIKDMEGVFAFPSATSNKEQSPMPMSITGKWSLDDAVIQMKELAVDGLNSKGAGTASVRWNSWYPTISTELKFEYIDYLKWKKIIEARMAPRKADNSQLDDSVINYDFNKENPLPSNIEIKLDASADKVLFGKEEWRRSRLNAVLDNGVLTINQGDIALDGDGLLSIFGVVSQGGTGDLRFEGNMEAKGASLRKALSMFYSSASDLPTSISMGEFSASANLYINAQQIRLFEANVLIDGVPLSGTLTTFLEAQPRIETKVKIKDVNFDHVRNMLRKQRAEAERKQKEAIDNNTLNTGSATDLGSSVSYEWLKNLTTRLDAKIFVDGFTFMDRKGEKASFSIYAHNGDFRLSDLQLVYPDGGSTELSFYLDVKGALPVISLMMNADLIDTRYFSMDTNSAPLQDIVGKEDKDKQEDAEAPIPVEWMDYFNGMLDISIRKLIHKNITLEKIKLQGRLENKKFNIQRLGFIYSQAQTNIVGTLFGGKIPGLLISFTMSNADIYEMLYPITGISNISGYSSLSGTVSTTGWNFKEWLQQMDAKFLLAARGVKVQGVNIAGVSNVVDVARSSADVFNNVNNVLTKGSTEFSVDGSVSIKNGEMYAPGLTLRTGLVTGSVMGGIKLDSFTGQFSTLFRFANLSSEAPPTLIIQVSGRLDKPEIKVDTASLEDFVAKRNVGK
jgi:hypothetical protein